jgi:hypothetical protein
MSLALIGPAGCSGQSTKGQKEHMSLWWFTYSPCLGVEADILSLEFALGFGRHVEFGGLMTVSAISREGGARRESGSVAVDQGVSTD